VRAAEHRGQRDFVMTMTEARDIQADLAKLLLALHASSQTTATSTSDTVEIAGGEF
jgi:hypothetical protein